MIYTEVTSWWWFKQFDFRSSESDEAKLSVLREETFTVV